MRWLEHPNDDAEALLRQALDDATRRTGDEVSRRRIWTRVSTAERAAVRPRPWALTVLVGAAIAAGAAGAWFVWPTPRTGAVAVVNTPAPAPLRDANAIPDLPVARPAARRLVKGPSVVRTGARERAKFMLANGAEADLGTNSVLAVDVKDRTSIQRGRVTLVVPERARGERFVVTAARYRIVVMGTRFHVRVADDSVGVDVDEGLVEIWRGKEAVQIGAGESWTSPSRGKRRSPGASVTRPARRFAVSRPPAATRSAFMPSSVASVPPPAPLPVAPAEASPAEQFRDAQAAVTDGRPERAIEILFALSQGEGPTAENAAYEVGRVYRDHLGRPGQAVSAWQRYRQRHPRGLLRAETDISILETLATVGDRAGALAEAEAFLDRHRHSERREEVSRLAERLRAAAP